MSALIAYVGASPNTGVWLGIVYNAIILIAFIAVLWLIRTQVHKKLVYLKSLVWVLVAILRTPILVPDSYPSMQMAPIWLPSIDKAIFTLIAALIAIAIFFLAVIAQMVKPATTSQCWSRSG